MGLNLSRIFANAVARRVAFVVVGVVFAFVASCFQHASAANFFLGDRGAAYSDCVASITNPSATSHCIRESFSPLLSVTCPPENPYGQTSCGVYRNTYFASSVNFWVGNTNSYYFPIEQCPPPATWDEESKSCGICPSGVALPGSTLGSHLNQVACRSGAGGQYCEVLGLVAWEPPFEGFVRWFQVGTTCDPEGYECPAGYFKDTNGNCTKKPECGERPYNADTNSCEDPVVCPEGSSKDQFGNCKPDDNTCPAGQIKSPEGNCLPGDGQCATGEVRGSDGSCKKDSDGDGEADEGEDSGKFSGGESCDAPPQCSGDNIMCGQAVIQWRIDCNTRRQANISGGACEAMPVCAGENCDPIDYAQLIVSWRATCALERMGKESGVIGDPGDGDGESVSWDVGQYAEGVVDAAAGEGEACEAVDGCSGTGGPGDGEGELDDSGLGWSRSCPTLPSVSFMGSTIDFNAVAGGDLCDWISLGGQIVLLLAALASLRILSGGMG